MRTVLRPYAPRLHAVFPWLLAAVAIAVYANALQNGFAFDDEGIILRNGLVHHIDGAWRAFLNPYWPTGAGQYRPLVIASFSAEWAVWGANPVGYHALNVVWHAAASVLVYWLARRWLSFGGAAVAAALFAVHAVHVEAVSNVVGRAELMATCGVLAMLILHGRRSPWAIAAYAAALCSKENAFVMPFLVAALDIIDRMSAPKPREQDARERLRFATPLYAGYAAVAIVWASAVFLIFRHGHFAAVDSFWVTMDTHTRWLTMLGVVPVWARLWYWPLDLSSDYSPQTTRAWPDNFPLALIGALILLTALMVIVARRRNHPVVIALFWMAATMVPVANVLVPTGVIVAERTLYLSSIGAVLLLGYVVERVAVRGMAPALLFAGALALVFAGRTWTRTPVWKSNRVLFLATVTEHPEASWTHVILARVLDGNGARREALDEYRVALKLFDRNPVMYADAVDVAVREQNFALADSLIAQADARFARNYLTTLAHAYASLEQRRFDDALRTAQLAASIAPDSARPRYFAALAWLGLGSPDSARASLARIPADHPLRKTADSINAAIPPGT